MIITINLLHKPILYIICNAKPKERKYDMQLSQDYAILCPQSPFHLIRRFLGKRKESNCHLRIMSI